MRHLPAPLYETLPAGYLRAAWAVDRGLPPPWAWLPESMFLGAAVLVVVTRTTYRFQARRPFYGAPSSRRTGR